MFPIVNIFGRSFTTYALVSVFALVLCGIMFCRFIKKAGKDDNDAIVFLLTVAVGILLGGHLLYGITNVSHFGELSSVTDIKSLFASLSSLFGGSVFYGGLIGGGLAGVICIKRKRLDMPLYADIAGVITPLFHGFARIGCFLGGCCYGIESEFGFVARGNFLVPEVNVVSRFPVQLLEAVCNFLIFGIVFVFYLKGIFKGRLMFVYLGIYAVVRFFDEFLRGDLIRGFVFGLSTSQFISIFVEIFAIAGFVWVSARKRKVKTN